MRRATRPTRRRFASGRSCGRRSGRAVRRAARSCGRRPGAGTVDRSLLVDVSLQVSAGPTRIRLPRASGPRHGGGPAARRRRATCGCKCATKPARGTSTTATPKAAQKLDLNVTAVGTAEAGHLRQQRTAGRDEDRRKSRRMPIPAVRRRRRPHRWTQPDAERQDRAVAALGGLRRHRGPDRDGRGGAAPTRCTSTRWTGASSPTSPGGRRSSPICAS